MMERITYAFKVSGLDSVGDRRGGKSHSGDDESKKSCGAGELKER